MVSKAKDLASRRMSGTSGPLVEVEQSFEAAFLLQQQVCAELGLANYEQATGFKCALPADGKPIIAPLQQVELQTQTHTCLLFAKDSALVEPELVFVMANDLPATGAPYSEAQIDEAIGSIHIGLELIQSRYREAASYYQNLADSLLNQGLYIGQKANLNVNLNEFSLVVKSQGDTLIEQKAIHPNQHAKAGLYWLVAFLNERGLGLKSGQKIITGSYAGVLNIPLNQPVTLQFGDLGVIETEFKKRETSLQS